jgi:hypothetical protein
MNRFLLAVCVLGLCAVGARADRIAPIASPVERALRSHAVAVGKVTAIEKDTIDAPLFPGATNKVAHKIAVVKIETGLFGVENITHIKIGFVPPNPALRRGPDNPDFKVGEEWLFFLTKNETGGFYTIPYLTPPVESKVTDYKDQVAIVKNTLATIADPAKAMKAEKPEDRFNAALAILYKFRAVPEGTRETETITLSAEESRPILRALSEGKWKTERASSSLNGYSAFAMLGLTDKDGWKQPKVEEGKDFFEQMRVAYNAWLEGAGKDYRIKKLVPKTGK